MEKEPFKIGTPITVPSCNGTELGTTNEHVPIKFHNWNTEKKLCELNEYIRKRHQLVPATIEEIEMAQHSRRQSRLFFGNSRITSTVKKDGYYYIFSLGWSSNEKNEITRMMHILRHKLPVFIYRKLTRQELGSRAPKHTTGISGGAKKQENFSAPVHELVSK